MNASDKIVYYLVLAWFWLLSKIPIRVLFFASEVITFFVYRIVGYRKEVVLNNLSNAFPTYSRIKIKQIARKYYRHLSIMIVENIYFRFEPIQKLNTHLFLDDLEILQSLYQQKRNIIIMLGHFGNWEVVGLLSKHVPYKFAAVYKQLTSKIFDQIYYETRSRMGILPVEMKETFRMVHTLHHDKNPFALIMVADQAPTLGDTHHWMTFMNQDTGVFLGSEKLAKKFDMPVVYLDLIREKKGQYKARIKLITDTPKLTTPNEITESYFHLLEHSIYDAPRYWVWSHRRWKHKRKN